VARPSTAATSGVTFTGVGPFRHNIAENRDPNIFGGTVTVHTGPKHPSYLMIPVIPEPGDGQQEDLSMDTHDEEV
jgi:hypothetical protein